MGDAGEAHRPGRLGRVRLRPALLTIAVALGVIGAACSNTNGKPRLSRAETGGAAPVVQVSRHQRPRADLGNGRAGDHIHEAFGIYICDHFLPPVTDQHPDALGIHTHGEGVIHIHPFSNDVAGPNARLRAFFADIDLRVTAGDLTVGRTHVRVGTTTCAGQPAGLVLAYWMDATHASTHLPDRVFTRLLGDAPLDRDLGAYTLAFVAKGAKVPPPPTAKTVRQLGNADR